MLGSINVTGYFYTTYKKLNLTFGPDTFRCAEETVAELLNTATTSEHPGMLLGKVQSGKTRTFISIIALAFDNSFDIAIVLSKNSKALIQQTAKRLGSEFKTFIDEGELHEIYDIMLTQDSFSAFELDSKLIFVAKKQADNLSRLIALFSSNSAMVNKRIIIIDDEADNASIGYSKKEGLIEANTIARQVSELRSVVKNSSFLQVTATPYSLYLQPTDIDVTNVTEFMPVRPAFTKLVPVPNEYVGGETYFGESSRSETDTIESLIHYAVDHREFDRLKRPDARSFKLEDVLTAPQIEGYRTAIVNFIVGGCIQRINGKRNGENLNKLLFRYSFLLHSEAAKDAHDWQEGLTSAIVNKLKTAADTKNKLFADLVSQSFNDLSRSLVLASQSVPTLNEVLSFVDEALKGEHITIVKVNSDEEVATLLDNTGQLKLRSPLNIFLGGQVLDRGVTLANLIGFYYGRRPQKFQQDTVLQHSRMYGYRRKDLAVTRFYTSNFIRSTMTKMEEFDVSLRAAIEAGGDRAVQFIRKATDGTIVPCSPNKILITTTQTLRPHKRILPIGFQTGYRTGNEGIGKLVEVIDSNLMELCGYNSSEPKLVPLATALDLLNKIEPTIHFPEEDGAPPFVWDTAKSILTHLSQQNSNPAERGKVLLWTAKDRNSSRYAGAGSHATFIESPDSQLEAQLAKTYAKDYPILFLLRQNGDVDKGWRGTPFYWPVIRAQAKTPTAIYTAETI